MMKNLIISIRKYSTSTFVFPTDQCVTLNPRQYKSWTEEEVCSLLVATEENGGAGLTLDDVKPLYDAGFNGTSLANIVTVILKDKSSANEMAHQVWCHISHNTMDIVVLWVDHLLKTNLKTMVEIPVSIIDFSVDTGLLKLLSTLPEHFECTYKQPILPTFLNGFQRNQGDFELYSSSFDTLRIPSSKGEELRQAIDESRYVGREITDKTIHALIDVFIFDDANQLVSIAPDTVYLSTPYRKGGFLNAIYKQFTFLNVVMIDTNLSFTTTLDTISSYGRTFVNFIIGTLQPWFLPQVAEMLFYKFNISQGESEEPFLRHSSIRNEFLLVCYLLSGSPEHVTAFHREVLKQASLPKYQHLKVFTENHIREIFLGCVTNLIDIRWQSAEKRVAEFLEIDKLKRGTVLLELLFGLQSSVETNRYWDETLVALIEKSIAPVIEKDNTKTFGIVDPIAFMVYSKEAFKQLNQKMWQTLCGMHGVYRVGEDLFEWFMIMLLMHETIRCKGKPCTNSPLFSGLKGYDNYELNVQSFVKNRSFNKDKQLDNNGIPGIWLDQLDNICQEAYVFQEAHGVFFLKPNNSCDLPRCVTTSISLEADTLNDPNPKAPLQQCKNKYLHWMVNPNMACNEGSNDRNECDLHFTDVENIADCIEYYKDHECYKKMKELFSNFFPTYQKNQ